MIKTTIQIYHVYCNKASLINTIYKGTYKAKTKFQIRQKTSKYSSNEKDIFFKLFATYAKGKSHFESFNLSWKWFPLFNIAKKKRRKCCDKKMILARVNVKKHITCIESYKNKSENINTFNIYTLHGIPKIQHIFNT